MIFMAYVLKCLVTIGSLQIDQVNEVVIDSDSEKLSDMALIRLPSKIENKAKELEAEFSEGDKVSIKLWYEGYEEREEFSGYVKRIRPNQTFDIECEDLIYSLDRTRLEWIGLGDTDLNGVLAFLAQKGGFELIGQAPDIKFKYLTFEDTTISNALLKLRDEYKLTVYVRDGKVYVGRSENDLQGEINYDLSRNIVDSQLEYLKEDHQFYDITAVGYTDDNQEITVRFGPEGAPERTLFFFNIDDAASLKVIAEEESKKLNFEGYKGDILAFGLPYARHGMIANITDPEYPARAGRYFIHRVQTSFGVNGFRRNVFLGRKL